MGRNTPGKTVRLESCERVFSISKYLSQILYLSEHCPSQRYNPARISILSSSPKSQEMQGTHSNDKYLRTDTAMLFLETHLQDMPESVTPSRRGWALHRRGTWSDPRAVLPFGCIQASANRWLPATEQEILAGGTSP